MQKGQTAGRTRRTEGGDLERRVFSGRSWTTRRPIVLPDRGGKPHPLKAHGSFGFRVLDAGRTASALGASRPELTSRRVTARLSARIADRVAAVLHRVVPDVDDLPLLFNDVATEVRLELKHEFAALGVDLIDFFVASIHPEGKPARARASRRPVVPATRPRWGAPSAIARRLRPAAADGGVGAPPMRLPEVCPVCGGDAPGRGAVCPRCGARRKGSATD